MKTLSFFIQLILIVFIIISCQKDEPNAGEEVAITKEKISGFVQKGPFNNGTDITIFELNDKLIQTGNSFNTQISNNSGLFELNSIELKSNYVEIKATGFYFNEVKNDNSIAPLTLYAISDLTDKSDININILSHLEKLRVQQLVSENKSFSDAKKQAQKEVLNIFKFQKEDIISSELLNITKNTDDNAILLAISAILQGNRTVAELSELLAYIITDIKEDGTLDDENIGSDLVNHAKVLNLFEIRENIENRYADLEIDADIPDFEFYVNLFLDSAGFEITNFITYPEFSDYGENILYDDKVDFTSNVFYSLSAEIPTGNSLKIIIKGGLWWYNVLPNGPVNWNVSEYNFSSKTQIFTSAESGKSCDLKISFDLPQEGEFILVEYYENDADEPTKTKQLNIANAISGLTDNNIIYPETGEYGLNILYLPNDTFYTNINYSLNVKLTENFAIRVGIKGESIYSISNINNWIDEGVDSENNSHIFYSGDGNRECDLQISFTAVSDSQNTMEIEYYESMAIAPDFTKIVWIINE